MTYDWYDEMERAEQEYDAKENEMAQEYKRGYEQGRADAIEEFEPLLKLLVDMENDYICNEMSVTEYCEENCKYDCPQKECYLRYLELLEEQK